MTDRALARIDLSAVEQNCAELRRRLDGAELCAVVKADGYGHGAAWCARAAISGGAGWLAVATAEEAADLRRHGVRERLLVMGAMTIEELEVALASDADVVVWRRGFADLVARKAEAADLRVRVHVKLDTGMGRLGAKEMNEALDVVAAVGQSERLELTGAMTHLATADEPESDFFEEQLQRFRPFAQRVKEAHPDAIAHAANSAGVLRDRGAHFDMARCGIAVYGLDPFHEDPALHGLEPVLRLESYVADVKRMSAGDTVGYGRRWTAAEERDVAVLPIGYGDGYRRGLSNNADVLIGGRRYPVAGTISMDNVTVDLGPRSNVRPGEPATLIGADGDERILAEELARRLGTINYEITCGISARVRRLYHGG
jgi:alanine racemase